MEPQQQATCESAIPLGDADDRREWQQVRPHAPERRYPAAFNDPTAKRVGLCLEPDEASTAQPASF